MKLHASCSPACGCLHITGAAATASLCQLSLSSSGAHPHEDVGGQAGQGAEALRWDKRGSGNSRKRVTHEAEAATHRAQGELAQHAAAPLRQLCTWLRSEGLVPYPTLRLPPKPDSGTSGKGTPHSTWLRSEGLVRNTARNRAPPLSPCCSRGSRAKQCASAGRLRQTSTQGRTHAQQLAAPCSTALARKSQLYSGTRPAAVLQRALHPIPASLPAARLPAGAQESNCPAARCCDVRCPRCWRCCWRAWVCEQVGGCRMRCCCRCHAGRVAAAAGIHSWECQLPRCLLRPCRRVRGRRDRHGVRFQEAAEAV